MEQKYYVPPCFPVNDFSLESRDDVKFVLSELGSFNLLSSAALENPFAFFVNGVFDLSNPAFF